MSQACATVTWLRELQANANAESARQNTNPPCAIPCPLTMSSRTGISSRAVPSPTATSRIPSPALAVSSAHIAAATRVAKSSIRAHIEKRLVTP